MDNPEEQIFVFDFFDVDYLPFRHRYIRSIERFKDARVDNFDIEAYSSAWLKANPDYTRRNMTDSIAGFPDYGMEPEEELHDEELIPDVMEQAEAAATDQRRTIPLTIMIEGTKVVIGSVDIDMTDLELKKGEAAIVVPQHATDSIKLLHADELSGSWVCFRIQLPE
jgi:hypothetical protein